VAQEGNGAGGGGLGLEAIGPVGNVATDNVGDSVEVLRDGDGSNNPDVGVRLVVTEVEVNKVPWGQNREECEKGGQKRQETANPLNEEGTH